MTKESGIEMEKIGSLLSKAGQEKSLATTQPRSQPRWAGLLWTLAQSRTKELTTAEVALWKAKLSGYSDDLVEWALVKYNGEFFPNPSTICRMIEVKREAMLGESQNREWNAYKATQAQAAREGQLASDEQYEELRAKCREIMTKAPVIRASGRAHGKSGEKASVSGGDRAAGEVPAGGGSKPQDGAQVGDNAANEPGCLVATSQEDD